MASRRERERSAESAGGESATVVPLVHDAELFRRLVESVRDYAIFMLDPSGRVATWNIGAERIKGYRADEIIGRHFSTFYPEHDVLAGKCELEIALVLREGRFEEEGWRIRKDGSRFWAKVVINAVRDDAGQLIGFSKVTQDLTERKKALEEQAGRLAAEQRLRLLVESVRDYAILMLDPEGYVATWNAGAERLTGYKGAEIIGQHFSVFYPREDVSAGKCQIGLEVAAREGHFEVEGWRQRKDGTAFWANVVINAVRDDEGVLRGFSKVTQDLTERRKAKEEQAARLIAEQSNRAKDEFLAMLGHELRNPLAPILTALQLLKLRSDHQMTREQEVIERQVKHMINLVDDLLDVSRITRGKVALKQHPLDVRDVVAKAVELAAPLLEQRRHHFDVDAPTHEVMVFADEARLTQVFANLLLNAAKYTEPEGHISVTVAQAGDMVSVAVRDDGIGITPDLLPRVFDLFEQGYQAADRSGGGLGIGLALVRSLVQMHGGTVAASSDGPGSGSTFTIVLPIIAAEAVVSALAPRKSNVPHSRKLHRILIVDDNEDALTLLAAVLSNMGHEVVTAGDPAAALLAVKTFSPDFAILDIGLPVMDGYALAPLLLAALAPAAPRLIALTGYGQNRDRERSRVAGFHAHLVKPVDTQRLLDTISELDALPPR